MDAEMAKLQNEYAVAREDLEKARKNYHTAMMNVPGGQWDAAAWEVYAAQRPSVTCSGIWFWKKCRSHREEHFSQYNHEAKQKAEEALVNEFFRKSFITLKFIYCRNFLKRQKNEVKMFSTIKRINKRHLVQP